jgi:hypothetical protein
VYARLLPQRARLFSHASSGLVSAEEENVFDRGARGMIARESSQSPRLLRRYGLRRTARHTRSSALPQAFVVVGGPLRCQELLSRSADGLDVSSARVRCGHARRRCYVSESQGRTHAWLALVNAERGGGRSDHGAEHLPRERATASSFTFVQREENRLDECCLIDRTGPRVPSALLGKTRSRRARREACAYHCSFCD